MLLENAKQLLKTVKESFPTYSFEFSFMPICNSGSLSDIEAVQCAWLRVLQLLDGSGADDDDSDAHPEIESALLLFLRRAQKLMSSAASNYNLRSLCVGLCIAGFAVWLTLPTAMRILLNCKPAGMFLMFNIISYSGMMFASSYVEEEQQFWYWVLMGWVFYLHVKYSGYFHGKTIQSPGSAGGHRPLPSSFSRISAAVLGVSYRILRRWNQTGQKFAAEPDIARSFFPSHQHALWALVILTYADSCSHLLFDLPLSVRWRLFGCAVALAALLFKVILAASDSPELIGSSFLGPIAKVTDGWYLVYHARIVLCGISVLMMLSMYAKETQKTTRNDRGKYHCRQIL
jgi:ethanolaminephosphotransferase